MTQKLYGNIQIIKENYQNKFNTPDTMFFDFKINSKIKKMEIDKKNYGTIEFENGTILKGKLEHVVHKPSWMESL